MILRRNMFMRRAPEDEQRKSRSDEERENAALRMARAELLGGSSECIASRNHACMILRRNMFMRRAPEDEQRESRSDEERENAALRMARAELDCFPHCKYVENPVY